MMTAMMMVNRKCIKMCTRNVPKPHFSGEFFYGKIVKQERGEKRTAFVCKNLLCKQAI